MAIPWQRRDVSLGRGEQPVSPLVGGVRRDVPINNIPDNAFRTIGGFQVTPKGLAKWPPFRQWYRYATAGGQAGFAFPARPTGLYAIDQLSSDGLDFPLATAVYPFALFTYQDALDLRDGSHIPWWDPVGDFEIHIDTTAHTLEITDVINDAASGINYPVNPWEVFRLRKGDIIYIDIVDYADIAGADYVVVDTVTPGSTTLTWSAGASSPPSTGDYTAWAILRNAGRGDVAVATPYEPFAEADSGQSFGTTWLVSPNYLPARLVVDVDDNVLMQSFLTIGRDSAQFNWQLNGVSGSPKAWTVTAAAAAQFRGFFFIGNTDEYDGPHPDRVRWANPFDPMADWTDATAYADLGNSNDPIVRIVANNEQIVVYCRNSVWYGFETSDPLIPVAFRKLDTGGVGLTAHYGVCQASNTHFFIGQGNIYALNGPNAPQLLGTPIAPLALKECAHPELTWAAHHPARQCIVFALTRGGDLPEVLWIYDYRSGGWSSVERRTNWLFACNLQKEIGADAVSTAASNANTGVTASDLALNQDRLFVGNVLVTQNDLYGFGAAGRLGILDFDNASQADAANAVVMLETGAIDLEQPDVTKEWTGLRVQVDDQDLATVVRRLAVVFDVYGTGDDGQSWRKLGVLRVRSGQDAAGVVTFVPDGVEGSASFYVKGSTLRLRLVSESLVASYTLTQYTTLVKAVAPVLGGS